MANVYDFVASDEDSDEGGFQGFSPRDVPNDTEGGDDNVDSDTSSVRTADLSDQSEGSDIDVPTDSDSDDGSIGDDNFDVDTVQVDFSADNFQLVQRHYFTQPSGPHLPQDFDTASSPLGYFYLLFPRELIEEITRWTNSYAQFCILAKRAKKRNWEDKQWPLDGTADVTFEEMRAYLGLDVLFGVCPRPQYKDYWSSDIYVGNPGVKAVMNLKRYEKITQYFHVSERKDEPPVGSPDYDKLYKVRHVMNVVGSNCKDRYKPREHQAIDEGMVAYKGREKHVMYMPAKPVKRGIKLFCRCDSQSGYLHQLEVYLGKLRELPTTRGVYFDVIDRLTQDVQGKYFRIYYDNLYTSIPLALYLLENKTYSTGTIRVNRKLVPKQWPSRKLNRGEHVALQDKIHPHLTLVAWQDTKVVRVCSTAWSPDRVTHCLRRVSAVRQRVNQPLSLSMYNKYYAGVDRFDQRRAKYRVGRFSRKSWKYLFHFYVNAAIVNAWVLYAETSTRQKPKGRYEQLQFRHELMKELIGGYAYQQSRAAIVKPPVFGPDAAPIVQSHANVHMQAHRVRRCVAHSRFTPNGRSIKQTAFGCRACGVHLCKECHPLFHQ